MVVTKEKKKHRFDFPFVDLPEPVSRTLRLYDRYTLSCTGKQVRENKYTPLTPLHHRGQPGTSPKGDRSGVQSSANFLKKSAKRKPRKKKHWLEEMGKGRVAGLYRRGNQPHLSDTRKEKQAE